MWRRHLVPLQHRASRPVGFIMTATLRDPSSAAADATPSTPTTEPTQADDTGVSTATETMLVDRIEAAFVPRGQHFGDVIPWAGTFDELEAELRRDGATRQGKDGRAIVMSAFGVGEGRTEATAGLTGRFRQGHLITSTTLLGLDFDSRAGDPETIVAALRGYDAIIYSTHSHGRPDKCRESARKILKKLKPDGIVDNDEVEELARSISRFRVLLRLSRSVTAGEYRRLWLLADTLCGGGSDGSCKDPTRLYYTPRVRAEDAVYEPFFHRWHGEALDPDALPDGRKVCELPHPDEMKKGRSRATGGRREGASAVAVEAAAAAFAALDDDTRRRVGEVARADVKRVIELLRKPEKLDSRHTHLFVCGCRIGENSGFSDDAKKFVDEFVDLTCQTALSMGLPDEWDNERHVMNGVHKGQQYHIPVEELVSKVVLRARLSSYLHRKREVHGGNDGGVQPPPDDDYDQLGYDYPDVDQLGYAPLAPLEESKGPVQRTLNGDEEPTQKPTITCDADLPGMVSQVLDLLGRAPKIYQRGGSLVMLSTAPPSSPHELRRVDLSSEVMSIKYITEAYGRELLCKLADWTKPKLVKEKATKDAEAKETWIDVDVLPPVEVVRAVLAPRPNLGDVRVLTGFVQSPCIRPDGTLLTAPGYDVATGLYHHKSIDVVVPDSPTQGDAVAAVKKLLALVEDFPFEEEHHKTAWVAAVLTSLARHAIDGCAPLFMFEAPQKGTGKGLLAITVPLITNGSDPQMTSWTMNDEEFRKRLLSLGRRGDPFIFLDNVDGLFGGPTLESILTNNTGRFSDRVLGTNQMESVNITSTWLATGNNVSLIGDMDRRIMPIRLDAKCPQPELRTGFKKPDLRGYIRENRAALVSAALTILRAYICAGKPKQESQAWGGYEEWSRLIVGAIVWTGLPDPGKGREELRAHDPKGQALDELLNLWPVIDPQRAGLRAQDLVAWCDDVPPELPKGKDGNPGKALSAAHAETLKLGTPGARLQVRQSITAALEMLGARDASNARQVGEALKRVRGQTREFDGDKERGQHRLVGAKDRNGVTLWKREVLRQTAKPY